VASPPPQAVGSTNLPASPHGDAGKQLRDSDAGADNGAGQVPGHVPTTAATGSQPVVPESMSTPVVTTNSGEFAISLDHATVQPPRSDFVVSNTVLTATISKPLSEGNGTYSVTAMLNPPSLGHVQAVVKVDGANVNVAIVAHTPEGHRAIAAHLDELRSDLAARGGDVQLSLSDGGAKGDRRDRSEPPPAAAQDSEETDTLVLTVAPAHGAKSLHVIL
jgi:flagellar hook-length control protein FliK